MDSITEVGRRRPFETSNDSKGQSGVISFGDGDAHEAIHSGTVSCEAWVGRDRPVMHLADYHVQGVVRC